MSKILHMDLFSGIGGFSLAADKVWDEVDHIFCDNNKFTQEVIRKNFGKDVRIYNDIRQVTLERVIADTQHSGSCRAEESRKDNGTQSQSQTREKLSVDEFKGDTILRTQNIAGGDYKGEENVETTTNTAGQGSQVGGTIREVEEEGGDAQGEGCKPPSAAKHDNRFPTVDLLTGGFPCQPFSQAGKRKGTSDDRFLWPEMFRVIKEFKPTWVVAENVRGILSIEGGLVFEQVCLDLESEGYEVQPFVIPAVAKNAPHRRDRVWFVANRSEQGSFRSAGRLLQGEIVRPAGETCDATDTNTAGQQDRNGECGGKSAPIGEGIGSTCGCGSIQEDVTDSKRNGCENGHQDRRGEERGSEEGRLFESEGESSNPEWDKDWLEVATEFCGVDDEFPDWVDKYMETESGYRLTKAGHRVERLKSLGNAIVPTIAVEIFKAIKHSMKGE